MRIYLPCVFVAFVLFSASGDGAPVRGGFSVPRDKLRIDPGEVFSFKETFRGGQRACILAEGDHRPVVDIKIQVFDANGKLVAEDADGGDYVAAIWYPPRDAEYRISVQHNGFEWNEIRLVLK